jgi:hypothetical protein
VVKGKQLRGQLVICCKIKQNASRRWYIESAFSRFAWTGTRWASHVAGEGIRHHISDWEHNAQAEQCAKEQGFVVID